MYSNRKTKLEKKPFISKPLKKSAEFGTEPLGKLLAQQAVPAAVGILIMSIYGIVDTIFVGQYVGANGIAAITVIMPITFLLGSLGMATGIGGASIISRAFGKGDNEKAFATFGNMILLTLGLALFFVTLGFIFSDQTIQLFGGRGKVLEPARDYFLITLLGIPFLAWAMMCNNVIRAEGFPKIAMFTLITPAIINLILDPIFIIYLDWGIKGAAWATTIGYIGSALSTLYFFLGGKSEMKITPTSINFDWPIIKEIASIGSVTLARQGTISVLSIVLNNSLFNYGGEISLAVYGLINRVMLFLNFPVLGVTQGFVPIVGYNYGAKLKDRVAAIIKLSMKSATIIATILFVGIMVFTPWIASIFTSEQELIDKTIPALRVAFIATPLIAINLIGSAYFQATGKAMPALLLALSKQGIFLIPMILLLPLIFGLDGIWMSFPIADTGAALVTFFYLRYQRKKDSI